MPHTTAAAAAEPTPPPSTLGQALNQKIRELLERKRWSQREFAQHLGVTQGAVSYMLAEKRRASVLDYYERLAGVFGVSLSVLIVDLEQHVGRRGGRDVVTEGRGVPHATSAPAVFVSTALDNGRDESVLRAVFQALFDARLDVVSERISARVDAAIAELEARQGRGKREEPGTGTGTGIDACDAPAPTPSTDDEKAD